MKNLYSEFEAPSKQTWLAQVEKEIKRKLDLGAFGGGLLGNVFVNLDDQITDSPSIIKQNEGWQIGQFVRSHDEIISALEGGVSCLHLEIDKPWQAADFVKYFENVHLNFIQLRLSFKSVDSETYLQQFFEYAQTQKAESLQVIVLENDAQENLKLIREIKADESLTMAQKLAKVLRQAEKYEMQNVVLSIVANEDFYTNIAQTKVLSILAHKITQVFDENHQGVQIMVDIDPSKSNIDPNLQTIIATQQAMSAAIGGATIIEINDLEYKTPTYSQNFGARITRNIQNILQQESFLSKVDDASKGSYFMEDLCDRLMKEVWSIFIKD